MSEFYNNRYVFCHGKVFRASHVSGPESGEGITVFSCYNKIGNKNKHVSWIWFNSVIN